MEVAVIEGLLGIVGALNLTLLGWLFIRQNALKKELDEISDKLDNKVERILEALTELKVTIALWQGRQEKIHEKS